MQSIQSSELQLPNPVGYEKPPLEEDDEDEGVEEGEEDLWPAMHVTVWHSNLYQPLESTTS